MAAIGTRSAFSFLSSLEMVEGGWGALASSSSMADPGGVTLSCRALEKRERQKEYPRFRDGGESGGIDFFDKPGTTSDDEDDDLEDWLRCPSPVTAGLDTGS